MCGRFVRDCSIPDIAEEFGVEEPPFDLPPSYNVAPGQQTPIIISSGNKKLVSCRWGFIPSWAKDPKTGYRMINARADTVAQKPAFRSAYKNARALVPANGFYEWKKDGSEKVPFYIRLKSRKPFGFAGLYSIWSSPGGEQICTCTIITTDANQLLEPVHDRMPVIIRKQDEDLWLDPSANSNDLHSLLTSYEAGDMECYNVSRLVNSPANNSPECIKHSRAEA
jgi:putative SOS response-associated peptidase YedK